MQGFTCRQDDLLHYCAALLFCAVLQCTALYGIAQCNTTLYMTSVLRYTIESARTCITPEHFSVVQIKLSIEEN
jgi:hypothetical protein